MINSYNFLKTQNVREMQKIKKMKNYFMTIIDNRSNLLKGFVQQWAAADTMPDFSVFQDVHRELDNTVGTSLLSKFISKQNLEYVSLEGSLVVPMVKLIDVNTIFGDCINLPAHIKLSAQVNSQQECSSCIKVFKGLYKVVIAKACAL